MAKQIAEFLALVGVFGTVFGVWLVVASAAVNLALLLPGEELPAWIAGAIAIVGLFTAIRVASQLAGRQLDSSLNLDHLGKNRKD